MQRIKHCLTTYIWDYKEYYITSSKWCAFYTTPNNKFHTKYSIIKICCLPDENFVETKDNFEAEPMEISKRQYTLTKSYELTFKDERYQISKFESILSS